MTCPRDRRPRSAASKARTAGALLALVCLLAACSTTSPDTASTADVQADPRTLDERSEALAHYATGVSLDLRGDRDGALKEYTQAAATDPSNQKLVRDVARRMLRNRDYAGAEVLLERAAREKDAPAEVHSLLGAVYAQLGKSEAAIRECEKAVALEPTVFSGHQTLFELHLQQENNKEALGVLDAASRLKETDERFLLDLSDQYARYAAIDPDARDLARKRAIAVLDRVKAIQSKEEPIRIRLADGYRINREDATAEALYLALLPETENDSAIRQRLLEIYIRAGDEAKIEEQLTELSGRNPTNPQVWYLLGGLYADQSKWPEAITNLKKAKLLNPNLEAVYFTLADVYARSEQSAEAVATLGEARALFGNTFQIEFATSIAYGVAKDYPSALKAITAAEAIATTSETNRLTEGFYFQLGAVHERNKKFESSESYFKKALEMNPDFAEALNYLGYMWAERGENLDEAFKLIDRAIKLEPENAAFLDSMAWVLHQQGKHREALRWMDKAIKRLEEPDPTIYDHLGDIQSKLGRSKEAREAWEKSVEIEDNPDVRRKLDRLEPNT